LVDEDGPPPTPKVGANGAKEYQVVLTGRATSVPVTAVLSGHKRTIIDNTEEGLDCAVHLLGRSRSCWIWLGSKESLAIRVSYCG
jgi:hypothetical protein